MNILTKIKNAEKLRIKELEAGVSDSASWHERFKHSAYVYAGGLDYGLTEGDLLAVFSQYGEIVDLHLVRDKDTGKSKGFAFLAYEDQRSTVLAVDNLTGADVLGRKILVEHVDNYKKRKAELEGEHPDTEDAAEEDPQPGFRGANPPAPRGGVREEARVESGPPRRGPGPPPVKAPTGGPSSEPWAAPGSIFALLEEARQMEAAKQGTRKQDVSLKEEPGNSGRDAGGKSSSRAREGRDKESALEWGGDPERARSGSAGLSQPPSYGPPRPPQRAHGGIPSDGAAEPGPGSSRGRGRGHERERREDRPRCDDREEQDEVQERLGHSERERGGPRSEERYGEGERDGAEERRRGRRSPSLPRGESRRGYEGGWGHGEAAEQRRGFAPGRDRERGAERDRDKDRTRDWERGRDRSRSREGGPSGSQKGSDRERWRERER